MNILIYDTLINNLLTYFLLFPQNMVIADIDATRVLGYDFIHENGVSINGREGSLALNGDKLHCELESYLLLVFRVSVNETVTVPQNSEVMIKQSLRPRTTDSEKGILGAKSW